MFLLTNKELSALMGLPHLQRLIYIFGLRPYVDSGTGIVGIKRGISYQSIREELYVEPHQGYKTGSPSKDQIRRGLRILSSKGIIETHSTQRALIFKLPYFLAAKNTRNKAATNSPYEAAIVKNNKETNKLANADDLCEQTAREQSSKAATPLYIKIKNNNKAQTRTTVIDDDFIPSSTILDKARNYDLDKAGDKTDVLKFITHNKTRGNVSANWNESYLGWLIKGKELQRQHRKGENTHVQQHAHARPNVTKRSHSAVDQVREAYRDVFSRARPTEKVID